MDAFARWTTAGGKVLAVVLAAVAAGFAMSTATPWATAALTAVAGAYAVLGAALAWHLATGVPLEGYLSGKHGWLIALRRWFGWFLLLPIAWPARLFKVIVLPRVIARDLPGREPAEPVLEVVWLAELDGLWVLSDRALYVGSDDALFWRFPFDSVTALSEAASGPWARTLLTVSVARPATETQQLTGLFTHKDAQRTMKVLRASPAGYIGAKG